jgi:peptidoglycan/xylan/chitin deacetylase (PgdA/CDA1 family)
MQACGLFALARARSRNMARILMYHNFCAPFESGTDAVNTTALRRQFEHLSKHYHPLSLTDLLRQLDTHGKSGKPAVALTIDDGRRNCYEFMFPLLKEFRMPATFYVVSSFIQDGGWVWTDKVLWLSEQPSAPAELSSRRIDLFFRELNRMRPETRNARIEAIAQTMKVILPKSAPPKYAPCSFSELREMADSGLVEIGSHTVSHPILSSLTDNESESELTESRAQIEEHLGVKVASFCFPNGKPEDYRESQVRQIQSAGYRCAVVAWEGMVRAETDRYQLPRIGVSGRLDALAFAKQLDGAEYYQRRLRRWMRS